MAGLAVLDDVDNLALDTLHAARFGDLTHVFAVQTGVELVGIVNAGER